MGEIERNGSGWVGARLAEVEELADQIRDLWEKPAQGLQKGDFFHQKRGKQRVEATGEDCKLAKAFDQRNQLGGEPMDVRTERKKRVQQGERVI